MTLNNRIFFAICVNNLNLFQRHFSVLAVNIPTREALNTIYSSILSLHMQSLPFNIAVARSVPSVVQAAIALHNKMIHHFLPSANKFYHHFSLWDLSQLFQVRRVHA